MWEIVEKLDSIHKKLDLNTKKKKKKIASSFKKKKKKKKKYVFSE